MATARREIEFPTLDQVTLKGWFYGVQGDVKRPCIIMASGVSRERIPQTNWNCLELIDCSLLA
jgi:hypothetical protein